MQLANKLNNAVEQLGRPPLAVFVQVNTSGEDTKYGVEPGDCTKLAQHIKDSCGHLRFAGLMTIGQPDYSSKPENFEVCPCLHWSGITRSFNEPGTICKVLLAGFPGRHS